MAASPRTREKIISGVSGSIARKGLGLGTGPVGNPLGYLGRPGTRGLLASSIISLLSFVVSSVLLALRACSKNPGTDSSTDSISN